MVSLKGYALKQFVSGESSGGCEKIQVHPVKGTTLKIGSSFVCHIVLKELLDVHVIISVNEHNQVGVPVLGCNVQRDYCEIPPSR